MPLEAAPSNLLTAAQGLGNLLFDQSRWAEAVWAYDQAVAAADALYRIGLTRTTRQTHLRRSTTLFARAAFAQTQIDRIQDAWRVLERGRTRDLREALAQNHLDDELAQIDDENVRQEIGNTYRQLAGRLAYLQEQWESPTEEIRARDAIRPQLEAARADLESFVAQVRSEHAPHFLSPELPLERIQASLPPATALLSLVVTGQGSAALFLTASGLQRVDIGAFTSPSLEVLITDLPEEVENWIGAFNRRGQDPLGWLQALAAIAGRDGKIEAGWLPLYRLAGALLPYRNRATLSLVRAWRRCIERTLGVLRQKLWPPLAAALAGAGVERVVLVPQGALFLLPLHAAAPEGLTVAYAPSAGVWAAVVGQIANLPYNLPHNAVLAANPTGDLPYTPTEAQAIAHLFTGLFEGQAQVLWRQEVTEDALLSAAASAAADVLHYSGHGEYNWDDPERSGLRLRPPTADDDGPVLMPEGQAEGVLSLADIREQLRLEKTRLVSLSACETGLTNIEPGQADEYVGLPAGFLLAGAPAVVASLWRVDDLSTTLLMERFYRLYLHGDPAEGDPRPLPIAGALAEAQRWLRALGKAEAIAEVCRLQEMWRRQRGQNYGRALRQYWRLEGARFHIEDGDEDPPFAHPYHWAAFQAVGAVL